MRTVGWRRWAVSFVAVAFLALWFSGCASMKDFKRVEEMAQQALDQSAEAKAFASDSAREAEASAAAAAESASRAEAAAAAAGDAAAKAEDMAAKSEAIFHKLMKK